MTVVTKLALGRDSMSLNSEQRLEPFAVLIRLKLELGRGAARWLTCHAQYLIETVAIYVSGSRWLLKV